VGTAAIRGRGTDRHGKEPVLTLTPNAESVIREILGAASLPESGGVRIAADEADGAGEARFRLSLVDGPQAGDQIIEDAEVPVYVEGLSAPLLDDRVLDATAQEDHVTFTVAPKGA
jgi:iron-sulfur cluster assembly protein